MPDRSDNCQVCGANPHESCGMSKMSHDAIDCPRNASAWDSRMDDAKELRPGEMPVTVFRLSGDESFESAWGITKDDGSHPYFDVDEEGIRLMPIYTYFMKRGYSGDEIENMTLKQIEEYLENRAMGQLEG